MATEPAVDGLFATLRLADIHDALVRNIVSLRVSEDLFDDLSSHPADWKLAQAVEDSAKPPPFRSPQPVIDRPFEDAEWFNAVGFPFFHWSQSRYSDGSFGVWYGADGVQTSAWESAYHWYCGFLADAGFQHEGVVGERKLYLVRCDAALLDMRALCRKFPALLHPSDYALTHAVGKRLAREGHPGLLTRSARYPDGQCYAIFNSTVLSQPRQHGALTYRLQSDCIRVESRPGSKLFEIPLSTLAGATGDRRLAASAQAR